MKKYVNKLIVYDDDCRRKMTRHGADRTIAAGRQSGIRYLGHINPKGCFVAFGEAFHRFLKSRHFLFNACNGFFAGVERGSALPDSALKITTLQVSNWSRESRC